jgi:hypothetical protein
VSDAGPVLRPAAVLAVPPREVPVAQGAVPVARQPAGAAQDARREAAVVRPRAAAAVVQRPAGPAEQGVQQVARRRVVRPSAVPWAAPSDQRARPPVPAAQPARPRMMRRTLRK